MARKVSACLAIAIALLAFRPAAALQEIYVDFDSVLMAVDGGAIPGEMGIPPADELYDYDPLQREDILFYLNDIYGIHEVLFLEGLPAVPGSTSVVTLNKGSGGAADGIDFRNLNDADNAEANTIATFKFLGKDPVTDPWTDDDVTIATANIVAHEANHLMGIRHQDAFGPISTGIGTFPDDYAPTYPFPAGAPDTSEALSFLTTGFGLSFGSLTSPSFISERSAIKLELAKPSFTDLVVLEISGNQVLGAAQAVPLADFVMPYPYRPLPELTDVPVEDFPLMIRTAIEGRARVVTGSLDATDSEGKVLPDYFTFEAEAGSFVTIEVMSAILEDGDRYSDHVDVGVILLDGFSGASLPYGPGTGVAAANDDDFDTSERGATLIDVELPVVTDTDPITGLGTYAIEIISADEVLFFVDPEPGPGKTGFDTGDYELLIYQAKVIDEPFPPGFADFNLDTDVDGKDFLDWQVGNGIPADATKADGDADNDFDVDPDDLFQWIIQYGLTGLPVPLQSSQSVPEPSTMLLLSVGLFASGLRPRAKRS
ncbi:MAG: PEP-CTERM sorting domain-containing protein [Planctomycetota bacterium]